MWVKSCYLFGANKAANIFISLVGFKFINSNKHFRDTNQITSLKACCRVSADRTISLSQCRLIADGIHIRWLQLYYLLFRGIANKTDHYHFPHLLWTLSCPEGIPLSLPHPYYKWSPSIHLHCVQWQLQIDSLLSTSHHWTMPLRKDRTYSRRTIRSV